VNQEIQLLEDWFVLLSLTFCLPSNKATSIILSALFPLCIDFLSKLDADSVFLSEIWNA
jgi:hypothetical protein